MILTTVKAQLIAFAAVTVVGVSYVGAEYAGLADRILDRGYTVRANFADSGGIYSGAEVTFRGVPVGRVGKLRLTQGASSGVMADLKIEGGPDIPADTLAIVAHRSAVGEQYVDLQPRGRIGPPLKDGMTIPRSATRVPLATTDMITSLDELATSVDKDDLRTTVHELGDAFAGTGPALSRLVKSGNRLVNSASETLPETVSLMENSETVLQTQIDQGSSIKSFSKDLADLTETIKTSDKDLRRLMSGGSSAATQLDSLLKSNRSALPVLFGNLVSGAQISVARLPAIEQTLVTFPVVVSGSSTVVPGDGTNHFGLVINADDPPPCRAGYGGTQHRDPADTRERPANTSARCTAPRGGKTSVRGAQNAPRGSAQGGSDPASYVSPYDPETGLAGGPDGQSIQIGSMGGEQNVFGKESWQWLLVGPMT